MTPDKVAFIKARAWEAYHNRKVVVGYHCLRPLFDGPFSFWPFAPLKLFAYREPHGKVTVEKIRFVDRMKTSYNCYCTCGETAIFEEEK